MDSADSLPITLQQKLLRKILVRFFGQKYEECDYGKWNWNLEDLFLKIDTQTFSLQVTVYLFMLALAKTYSKFNTDLDSFNRKM